MTLIIVYMTIHVKLMAPRLCVQAARSSLAVLPVAGAVVGTVLAGPLGLLAGFKVAGVAAAVGGGLLGFAGGNFIQRKKKERVALQLQRLDANHEHEHVQ